MSIFFLQKAKVLSGINTNTRKYIICSIKLETKALHIHKTQVFLLINAIYCRERSGSVVDCLTPDQGVAV